MGILHEDEEDSRDPVALLGCQRPLGLGDGGKGIYNWLQPRIQRVPA